MDLVACQLDCRTVVKLVHNTVDADARKTLRREVVQQGGVLALSAVHHRCQHEEFGARLARQDVINDLLRRLSTYRFTTVRAMGYPYAREHKAQVVVDFGNGAHCRTRVSRGRLLVDGDSGAQTLNEIDIRLVHLA